MITEIKKGTAYRLDPEILTRYQVDGYVPEKRYTVRLSKKLGRHLLPKLVSAELDQIEGE